jgi:hypothetical protein
MDEEHQRGPAKLDAHIAKIFGAADALDDLNGDSTPLRTYVGGFAMLEN